MQESYKTAMLHRMISVRYFVNKRENAELPIALVIWDVTKS